MLLEELREHEPVTVRFAVQRRTFDPEDGYEWRSFKVEGLPERPHLANLLRGIADHLDRSSDDGPADSVDEPHT